ncbi:MAG: hypothetical protein PHD76_00800 [Methylacidiphilales bacterium]|nr:hypothetical protein [Candidatus Methylacidiphilales bacterium]
MLPSSPRIALLACAVIGLGFSAIGRAADPEKPATLSEVRTWGDLLAQKPVEILKPWGHDGPSKSRQSFKIGIDRTRSMRYGGVVLYCLVQGDAKQYGIWGGEDSSLGPFWFKIQPPGDIARTLSSGFDIDGPLHQPGAAVLYMKTIPLDLAGDYSIYVEGLASEQNSKNATRTIIAQATVKVSGVSTILWMPWMKSQSNAENNASPADDHYSVMNVANPSSGVALPKCEGWEPIVIPKLSDIKYLLPEFIPSKPDAGLQLALEGNDLVMNFDEEISTHFSDEHFLTRWWVNGKPFIPKLEILGNAIKSRALDAKEMSVRDEHFRMEFHPEVLGVKKGDTVGVQLLFCPHGWEYVGPAQMAQAQESRAKLAGISANLEIPSISRLSNRIDFIYSGDPKSIAQP